MLVVCSSIFTGEDSELGKIASIALACAISLCIVAKCYSITGNLWAGVLASVCECGAFVYATYAFYQIQQVVAIFADFAG